MCVKIPKWERAWSVLGTQRKSWCLGIILMCSILLSHPWVLIPSKLNLLLSRTQFKREREDIRLLFELLINFLLSVLCLALIDSGTCRIFLNLS